MTGKLLHDTATPVWVRLIRDHTEILQTFAAICSAEPTIEIVGYQPRLKRPEGQPPHHDNPGFFYVHTTDDGEHYIIGKGLSEVDAPASEAVKEGNLWVIKCYPPHDTARKWRDAAHLIRCYNFSQTTRAKKAAERVRVEQARQAEARRKEIERQRVKRALEKQKAEDIADGMEPVLKLQTQILRGFNRNRRLSRLAEESTAKFNAKLAAEKAEQEKQKATP